MAYEPTTWQTGDVVTAEKMNKLEQGVANAGTASDGPMLVTLTDNGNRLTMDKTLGEIMTAMGNGRLIYAYIDGSLCFIFRVSISSVGDDTSNYSVSVFNCYDVGSYSFTADSLDDYPYIEAIEPDPVG